MERQVQLDTAAAHRHFSVYCFNRAWDLIEKADRTAEDDRSMTTLCQASIFHWSQRPDCEDRNMSIGYWQASRVAALVGDPAGARRYAETCMAYSGDLGPFYLGYAHEALARAAVAAGESASTREHLARAEALVPLVSEKKARERLAKDIADLRCHCRHSAGARRHEIGR